ncbi:MAG: glycerol-3-phosphate 1-O-acyltransferase PlsY [Lentisphaerae bacterium]|nr:glycerol-3-phosphate 1-O-acyltransferase PlsY [Lentisphaerota bacterium]
MDTNLAAGAALIAAYLIGAIPFGLIVSRARGVDIRKVGSGNIGATNVFRCVGKPWGMLVFALDMLKGLAPTACFPALVGALSGHTPGHLGLACGLAAVAGHNWPVYLGFKGGKGVATTTGVLLGVSPAAMGIGLLAWIVTFVLARYVSVASMVAAVVVAAGAWWMEPAGVTRAVFTLLAAFVLWRHKSNMQRLRNGTESRFDFKKKPKP